MSHPALDHDTLLHRMCARNDALDRKLDTLLRPLDLTRTDLDRMADLVHRVDPLVAKRVRAAVGRQTSHRPSFDELTRAYEVYETMDPGQDINHQKNGATSHPGPHRPPSLDPGPTPAPYWMRV